MTDQSGEVAQKLDYLPFGVERVNVSSGAFETRFTFTDQERDAESDLMYYGARYYNARIGRFTQADPVVISIGTDNEQDILNSPQGLNGYAYANNNPLKYVDPTGLTIEVNSETGAIMKNVDDGRSAIIAYPYVDGVRAEGPGEYWGDSLGNVQGPLNNITWDPVTNNRILGLDPEVKEPATEFINYVELQTGTQLRISDGYRSKERQNQLYNQSRTDPPTGPWATNLKGGESYHNYGLAIDVVKMEDEKCIWVPISSDIANFGYGRGFEWGGYWPNYLDGPKPDYPHFQMTFEQSISD